MTRIVWIGPSPVPDGVRMSSLGGVLEFASVEEAIEATKGAPVEVVILALQNGSTAQAIGALRAAQPDVQVLAVATGVEEALSEALGVGIAGVVDPAADPAQLAQRIHNAWIEYLRASGERELFLRLRNLNEEFLKNLIALDKRNIELTEKLQETAKLANNLVPVAEGERERILCVDDEAMICEVVSMALAESFDVETVLDAESAVTKLTAHTYHLVITDKNLPGMNGLELMRTVKASCADTDVVMMTGYASKESAIEALNLGAAGYLEKPFDLAQLIAKVDEVMQRQRERLRKRHYLQLIKDRNRAFLQQYGAIRTDLDAWIELRSRVKPA